MTIVTFCKTGLQRHAPELPAELQRIHGVSVELVECFDKCELCERVLLARIHGALVRLKNPAELLESLQTESL